jgi:hypothetical protein
MSRLLCARKVKIFMNMQCCHQREERDSIVYTFGTPDNCNDEMKSEPTVRDADTKQVFFHRKNDGGVRLN